MLKRKQAETGPIKLTAGDRAFYAVNTVLLALLALIVIYPLYFIIIASFSDPEKEFYRIWARKESLGKCVGSGVTATLEINVLEDTAFLKGAEYSLYDLEAPEGYSAALALKKG